MPSEVKMPVFEPDFVIVTGRLGHIASFRSFDAKKGDRYVRREDALAYADAKVRDALERAAQTCEAMHEEDRPGDYAHAIRALAQETKT